MFRKITAAAVTSCLLAAGIAAQTDETPASKEDIFNRIVSENTYSFELREGKIKGPAEGFLGKATERAQFVAFGEAHNKRAVHRFGGALFKLLNRRHGFEHLAIEEDPAWTRMLIPRARKSDSELFDLVLKFPNAFHLLSEEEILMIGSISRLSKAKEPVWGLNQVFSALHIYSRLAEIAPDETPRKVANRLFNEAAEYESERFQQNKHYLVEIAKASDFSELRKAFKPRPGTEADSLISQIELSFNIFAPYGTTPSPPSAVFYQSGKKRETNMKRLFADRYREARAASGKDPKVLAMFGHLHLYRGLSERTEQYTLGNLLSELALFNGGESFHIYSAVNSEYSLKGFFGALAKAGIAAGGDGAVIDLRPLFDQARRDKEMDPELRRMIMSFDAFVIFRDGEWGSVKRFETPNFRWYPE